MKFLGKATLPVSLVLAALLVAPPPAGAESPGQDAPRTRSAKARSQGNLFDTLFGGQIREKRREAIVTDEPAYVPAARITGPSYYDYKTDPLVKVNFASIAAAPATIAFEPSLAGPTVREAAAALQDFNLSAEKDIAAALVSYYAQSPEFIWVTGYSANSRAEAAIRTLGAADGYGLNPAEYALSVPSAAFDMDDMSGRMAELARFEMTMSARVLRYVRDAEAGRIDPNRISGYHDFPAKPVDFAGVLKTLAHTQEVSTYLESRHPQNPEYQALRVELEALRASEENEVVVDTKLLLKPGETSAELPKLLHLIARDLDDEFGGEHGEMLYRLGGSETYVPELGPIIKEVQKRAGLKPDGVIGPRTVASLAGSSKADRLQKVILALEELRWLPSDLGSPRVFINQPAFMASYIEGNEAKLTTRVVVGKPSNQTSFFYDEIEQVDYNPYWGVPQSIIVNEMLPRLRRDPGYLDRAGYEVTDAKGRRIPSSAVSWGSYGSKIPFNVRQTPSEANALGELKILFPNKHAIYMHDTPQKALFERDSRAFSHGCVRLADPRGMAAAVLGVSREYIADKLKQGHASEMATRKIPVYVAYFTAWPTLEGKVEYFDDVYGRDDYLKTAISKTEAVRAPAS